MLVRLDSVNSFLESGKRNGHIDHPDFNTLYMRKGRIYTEEYGWIDNVITIASVEVYRKGQGIFTSLIEHLQINYPDWPIYVERVITNRFAKYLESLGFERVTHGYLLDK